MLLWGTLCAVDAVITDRQTDRLMDTILALVKAGLADSEGEVDNVDERH